MQEVCIFRWWRPFKHCEKVSFFHPWRDHGCWVGSRERKGAVRRDSQQEHDILMV